MGDKKLYILTYEHGGYVLWKNEVKPRLNTLFEWMKKYPKLRIGLDYESFTFDEFSKEDKEVVELIGKLLKEYPDRVGLGATTYGQPLALTISEESNARQLIYAVRTNLSYYGKTPSVYSISEFALHNQTPQLIKLCGYEAAILRSHVMGYGYPRTFDSAWGRWIGKDLTEIPAVPTYDKQGRGYNCTTVDNWILSRLPETTGIALEEFEEMFEKYTPLLASRYDDLTQEIEPITAHIEEKDNYEYILLEDIPELFGEAKDELKTTDNDFHVQMPWGYCGNEIFNGVRKSEIDVVIAERLNAFSVAMGNKWEKDLLDTSWKYALAAQHHDVTICGLLDLARKFIPTSLKASEEVKEKSLKSIKESLKANDNNEGSKLVVNTNSFAIDEWIDDGDNVLHIQLPPFTAKVKSCNELSKDTFDYTWDENNGLLTTPCYEIKLNKNGIEYIKDVKTDKLISDNKNIPSFTAYIDDADVSSCGEWEVVIKDNVAVASYNGVIGDVPLFYEMKFRGNSPRIDCKTKFEVHNQRIGKIGDKAGLEKSLTVNGHTHESKLCFNLNLCLDKNRKMFRDLPYSISEWDGQVRKTEDYWYKKDRIIIDTPISAEESFESSTYINGIYWVSLKDSNQGLAIMNKGCMGSAVRGNLLSVPLVYSNEYMCGTIILDGIYEDEFAILPFDSDLTENELHKKAFSYEYSPVSVACGYSEATEREFTFAEFDSVDKTVIATAVYPEDDGILVRFCNYSDNETEAVLKSKTGTVSNEVDLLGNVLCDVTDGKLKFRPWEIKTVKITK